MFEQILTIVVPVFVLVGLGYLAARTGLLSQSVGEGLGQFVFVVAIPSLIFKTLATVSMDHGFPWALWAAYFSGVALTWAIATLIVRKIFARDSRAGVIAGVSAAFANTVMVGIPLVSSVLGPDGLLPLVLLISVHLPVMTIVIAVLMERAAAADGAGGSQSLPALLKKILASLMTNPIVIAILASLVWRVFSLPLTGIPADVINRLSSTALPVALFSLGMSMVLYGIRGNLGAGIILSVLKVLVMPAIVLVLCAYVFALPPVWTAAMTLTAASPTGVNVYIFATRYGTGHAMSANSITLTTAAAVVTCGLWVLALDMLGLI
ncbi:auxin efflux carrier [Pannonibacter phragmitetus]|uniref:Auxin efflux carrier n=1 Tax=Pannonibacter phragmitetus TaxID=121719 RepID=A0A379A0N4_9HYPH|nr:AEC family transporter [Pannonibacter phragmitetus]SUB03002.1 auxin efflux carrier [Pannonibacter phragmitetus]